MRKPNLLKYNKMQDEPTACEREQVFGLNIWLNLKTKAILDYKVTKATIQWSN